MRISESRLRLFIRKVLLESISDIERFTDPQNLSVYTSHDSFEDFVRSKPLSMSEEDKDTLLILMNMLLSAYVVDGGSRSYFNKGGEEALQKEGSLKLEFEFVFGWVEESIKYFDEADVVDSFGVCFRYHQNSSKFNNAHVIFDWIKSIGKTEKEFGINASNLLLTHGFALSDNKYNLNIAENGSKVVAIGSDFVEVIRDLEEARRIIDTGLKSGELINMFIRYGSELGDNVEMGEKQTGLFKYALGIDSDDSFDFSYSIYDAGNPYDYMRQIYDFISNLSYANDLSGRF